MIVTRNVTALAATALLTAGLAAEPATRPAVEPVLKPDPKVTAIINGLGDNEAARLPAGHVVGEFNALAKRFKLDKTGPFSRDYCLKMVWMPDRKRAIYMGANHGTPHKINDVWEYDLPSNTWVLLKNPDYNSRPGFQKTNAKTLIKDGMAVTESGSPVLAGHVFWGVTYDPNTRAYLMMNKHAGAPKGATGLFGGPWLFAFDPYTREWTPRPTKPPHPFRGFGCSLDYIPDLGKSLWVNGSTWRHPGTWTYDAKTNTWTELKVAGPKDKEGRTEAVTAWDSRNKVLVAAITRRVYHFDIATNTWAKVVDGSDTAHPAPFASDYVTPFGYDSANGVCLLAKPAGRRTWNYNYRVPCELWAYSPTDRQWTKLAPIGPPSPNGNRAPCGYYDPDRNVFVTTWGTTVWVYRYKKAAE